MALVPLSAAHAGVVCGGTVHGTVSLTADVTDCATGYNLDGPATIKLNGFTFDGTGIGIAIGNGGSYSLKVLGPGTITEWGRGIYSTGTTQVRRLTISRIATDEAVGITGDDAKVEQNTLDQ